MSTSTEIVLDTNVCVDLMNAPATAGSRVPADSRLIVPLIVIGELLYGAYKSHHVAEHLKRINDLSKMARIVALDWDTAVQFGHVRHRLISKGRTIPHDDMWIAAIALQHKLPVVSRDKHFREVDGLQVILW